MWKYMDRWSQAIYLTSLHNLWHTKKNLSVNQLKKYPTYKFNCLGLLMNLFQYMYICTTNNDSIYKPVCITYMYMYLYYMMQRRKAGE